MQRIRYFSEREIKKLLLNPNIKGIKNKSQIIYDNKFKLWAVIQKLKYPYKTSREIFEDAGFDMTILSDRTPSRRITFWINKYKKFGTEYFIEKNKYRYKEIDNDNEFVNILKENNIMIHKLIVALNNFEKYF